MCAVVCPFDVLTFHPLVGSLNLETAVAVKCDGCLDRVSRGEAPACAEACKVDALVYGEINELMASGRLRETGAVLAAAGSAPTAPVGGDPLAGWRSFGVARVAAAEVAKNRRSQLTESRSAPTVVTDDQRSPAENARHGEEGAQ
jgi:Fe-S-cluster-containing dehydrogenase component